MNGSSFFYLTRQGWRNMRENRLMTAASIGVLTACLLIIGIASLISSNVNHFVDYLGEQNEVVVFLKSDMSPEQKTALEAQLTPTNNIAHQRFISKEEALQEQMKYLKQFKELLAAYQGDKNPLPASYRVSVADLNRLSETADMLKAQPGVDTVSSPIELVRTLLGLKSTVNAVGWGLVIALGLVSIVVISNTIRLTMFARRREINIMKYVGATNAFIRLPFIVEGITVGVVAALLAFGLVSAGYIGLLSALAKGQTWLHVAAEHIVPYGQLWPLFLAGFLAGGIFVGGAGSATSMSKYLRV